MQKKYKSVTVSRCCSLLHVRRRPLGVEQGTEPLIYKGQFSHHREAQLSAVHLSRVRSAALRVLDYGRLNDLNASWLRTVTTGHLRVHLRYGTINAHITVFLVHVVGVGTTFVTKPHAVVVHLSWPLIMDFINGKDFTTTLLCLFQFLHKVPKFGSGKNLVLGKDFDSKDFWHRVL